MADPVVHSDTDGKVAILRNQIRDLYFKGEKTTLMCHNQFPIDINFCNMGHGIKTQYLTLSVASAQKSWEHHGSLVISPTVMIPISRIILLVIIRSRHGNQVHLLRSAPEILRLCLIS